ncbi:MAG: NUDIX domain-containing protein [Ardenticatenaceae bacterium]|nr:NUDIX domain-containing protein [Ardenticatenaceae bacterium]
METLHKVTAFILEERDGKCHLLTFLHPTAGRQLPAGTVEAGEAPEEAVLREVWEETGLQTTIHAQLLSRHDRLHAHRRMILRAVNFFQEPRSDAMMEPISLQRGSYIDINPQQQENGYVWGIHENFDFTYNPPRSLDKRSGWVDLSCLTDKQLRHYFTLAPNDPSPNRWWHDSDNHRWQLEWRPLSPPPQLMPPQDQWLAAVYKKVSVSATGGS